MGIGLALIDPQRWNRYAYALNNPLRYLDQNGKWPASVHEAIIRAAFRQLSPTAIDAILNGNNAVDNVVTGHLSRNAYQHGLSAPGQDPREARHAADGFIATQVALARNFDAAGHWLRACFSLG